MKSHFNSGPSKNKELEKYLREIEDLKTIIEHPERITSNLTSDERRAIISLKNKQSTKKADKGSTITVANTEKYIEDGETQLAESGIQKN